MTDASFASLSSTLLARKGGAKPAMRPQSTIPGLVNGAAAAANLEDLGWNDMGEGATALTAASPKPADEANEYKFAEVISFGDNTEIDGESRNDVRESLDRIAQQMETTPEVEDAESEPKVFASLTVPPEEKAKEPTVVPAEPEPDPVPTPRPKAVITSARRAAFTLRLDQQRHLMLKLACTVRGCSAQQLVSDALDGVLAEMPEIASLAAQVKR
ncbi:hypothetical protein E3U23_02370 [Erythrobacter litoralis]|uniref:hypothetical protein n=1 Tax=Erythrobacter litoralis TaxID=39960 RepID=UPI002435EE72|nr:hypothetical protein [Erythrobacter litoralis]MDG6078042.1 hypothetical protein [Erythrobacter litoralis]